MTTPICFIDTETTGVHPGREVWEIAMIRRDDGRPDQEVSFFVDVNLAEADPFGLNVGRFYERHPAGRWIKGLGGPIEMPAGSDHGNFLDRHTAARVVAKYTHGAHLVGAVPNFDAETLAPLLRDEWLTPAWHYHLVDVEALAVGWLLAKGRRIAPPWKSDDLSHDVEILSDTDARIAVDEGERHTALGDARWAMRLYDAIVGS